MAIDSYSELMFGILERAFKDSKRKRPSLMFTEFKKRFPRRPDKAIVPLWVAEFIEKHDITGYCRSVLARDLAFERRNKWMN